MAVLWTRVAFASAVALAVAVGHGVCVGLGVQLGAGGDRQSQGQLEPVQRVLKPLPGRLDSGLGVEDVLGGRSASTCETMPASALALTNLAEEDPSFLKKIFLYDHPPIRERIRMAEEIKG